MISLTYINPVGVSIIMIQSLTKQTFHSLLKAYLGSLIMITTISVIVLVSFVFLVMTYFNFPTGIIGAILTQWMILFLYGFGTLMVAYLLRTNQKLTWSVFKSIINQFLVKSFRLSIELGLLAFLLLLGGIMIPILIWVLFAVLLLYSNGAFLLILDHPTTPNHQLITMGFKKSKELLSYMHTLNVGNLLIYSILPVSMVSSLSNLFRLSLEVRQTISSVNVAFFLCWIPLIALHMMFKSGFVYEYSKTLPTIES